MGRVWGLLAFLQKVLRFLLPSLKPEYPKCWMWGGELPPTPFLLEVEIWAQILPSLSKFCLRVLRWGESWSFKDPAGFSTPALGFPGGASGEEPDAGLIPRLGRSPGGGHSNPLQCSCLENPRDGVAWWATVAGVAKSQAHLKRLCTHLLHVFSLWSLRAWEHVLSSHCSLAFLT